MVAVDVVAAELAVEIKRDVVAAVGKPVWLLMPHLPLSVVFVVEHSQAMVERQQQSVVLLTTLSTRQRLTIEKLVPARDQTKTCRTKFQTSQEPEFAVVVVEGRQVQVLDSKEREVGKEADQSCGCYCSFP
jgi:hypothetical protein